MVLKGSLSCPYALLSVFYVLCSACVAPGKPSRLVSELTPPNASLNQAVTPVSTTAQHTNPTASQRHHYGELPLSFAANHGQTDAQVKFLARGPAYSLFLTPTEAVLTLQKKGRNGEEGNAPAPSVGGQSTYPLRRGAINNSQSCACNC
jgi:hypothetical protein